MQNRVVTYQNNLFSSYLTSEKSVLSSYRGYIYGFQNQEVDPEIKGSGNSVNYKYRMHDPRLGRFFAVDPLTDEYPWNSPYAFSENNVIHMIELEGLEKADPITGKPDYSTTGGVHPLEYERKQQQSSSSIIPLGSNPVKPLELTKITPSSNSNIKTSEPINQLNRNPSTELSGKVSSIYEGASKLNTKLPKADGFNSGVGTALTVVDALTITEKTGNAIVEYQDNGNTDKLKEAGKDAGVFLFETTVVDRAITSGHPIGMILGGIYYTGKFVINMPPRNSLSPLQGLTPLEKDQDNTRVGEGMGF